MQPLPCEVHGPPSQMVHIIIVCFGGLNTLLTTWLTWRAMRKDRQENGKVRNLR